MSNRFFLGKVLGTAWAAIDGFRKILHLFLLLMLFLLVIVAASQQGPRVPATAALVIAPQGTLVDQLSSDPLTRAIAAAQGAPLQETRMKDLVDAIRSAKDDGRIKALVLRTDGLVSAGLSKLQELAAELADFKESGKPVIAAGDGFDRNQYYLAAQADQVLMHPMGSILIDGYSRFVPYYKSALDKLYVDYNVWTVGEYKSFVEPVTRDDMSEEDREASLEYLNALWESYQADVTSARELDGNALQRYADEVVSLLRAAGGDAAELALDYGLVDALTHRDEVRARLRELVGGADGDEADDFPSIDHTTYLRATRNPLPAASGRGSNVGVVVLSGTILDGSQAPGSIGGDSAARQIRNAASNDRVKALVLRVDSPGGSAFASEVIRREVEVFQESGRPVVVSMGSVAASGGYWISMSADEIWASPTTLTGSIGVGAALPTFDRTLSWLGVNIDGVGTTRLAGQYDVLQGLGEDVTAVIEETVVQTYDQFIGQVAMYRGRPVEEIDRVARGRVWVGAEAQRLGLVDRIGDLEDAIASAAELAGLEEGRYGVERFEPELGFAERLALELVRIGAPLIRAVDLALWPESIEALVESAQEPLEFFAKLNDPRSLYAYCFCDVR